METDRVYVYRKHLHWMSWLVPAAMASMALMTFGLGLAAGGPVELLAVNSGIFAATAVVIRLFLVRFVAVRVRLDEDALVYNDHAGERRLRYEEIESLDFPSVRYAGGWVKIRPRAGDAIRLTVVVAGISELVERLKGRVDSSGAVGVYDEDAMFGFLKTAGYSDASWERLYQYGARALVLVLAATPLGVVLGGALGLAAGASGGAAVLAGVAGGVGTLLYVMSVYMLSELTLASRLARGSDRDAFTLPRRDVAADDALVRTFLRWGVGLYPLAFVLAGALSMFAR